MNSDTESLAFMEEEDVSPAPKSNAPPAEVPRPRIMAAPSATPPKASPAKPPLHHAVSPPPPAAAAAAKKAAVPTRPGPTQLAGKPKGGRQDTASEFSDNESINFMVENNSMSGTPMRGVAAAVLAAPTRRASAPPRKLSRVASNSSIQFNSEPGSRSTSPKPQPRPNIRGSTPVEKAVAPHSPPPLSGNKAQVTNDSISFFFEQSDGSDQLGAASPNPQSATHRAPRSRTPVSLPPAAAAVAAAAPRVTAGSVVSNDSIAFHIDDESGDNNPHGQASDSPSTTPLVRATTTVPGSTFSVKSEALQAGQHISVADTSHNEFQDNSSIAFDVVDDSPAVKAPRGGGAATGSSKQPSAIPYYNSHARRSHSAQSRLNSRPNSPSIQFETDHNSDNDTAMEQSGSQLGGSGPSVGAAALPSFGKHKTTPSTLPMPEVLKATSPKTQTEAARNNGGGDSVAASSKKTIVTNHMQRRQQQQQQQRHGRLPSPQTRPPTTRVLGDGDLSLAPSTHPPLYQKTAVSTPIAAQAAGAAAADDRNDNGSRNARRSASLTDRNLPKKKDPTAVLNLQHPPAKRRSKESAGTTSQGVSPNGKLFTEAGSTGTTDSPPEPPLTGRHSRTSTEGHISAQSLAAHSSRRAGGGGGGSSSHGAHSPPTSVQGYLENQEVENAYYRDELTRRDHRTDRVLYREVSPPLQWAEGPGAGAVVDTVRGGGGGGAGEAAMTSREAEQWRRFNEQQRAELAQLRHRIAQARRQDRTLLANSPTRGLGAAAGGPRSRRGSAPQPTPMALASLPGWTKAGPGYSGMKHTSSAHTSLLQDASRSGTRVASTHRIGATATEGAARKASPQSGPNSARGQQQQQLQEQTPSNFLYAKQMSKLVSASARKASPSSRTQRTAGLFRPPSTAAATLHTPAGLPSRDVLHCPAAASVADMLGVLWPPRMAGIASARTNKTLPFTNSSMNSAASLDLYFVNGSRLTPQQVDRFMDLVQVQAEAEQTKNTSRDFLLHSADITLSPQSYRHFSPTKTLLSHHGGTSPRSRSGHDDPLALGSPDGLGASAGAQRQRAPLSAKLSALLLPKKAVRRSRVMREVFDVMDLKHQGSLVLDLLPSLTRLFEGELAALEQARLSLLQGRATPFATLLESAMASRQQYATAWGGRRTGDCTASGVHGSSSGLYQVLSADGAGLTAEGQAELLSLTHRLLLLSFAVNVVIPIASASRIPLLDFPTLCMVLYAAVDNVEHEMDSPREQWREVVQQYFVLLDS